MTPLTDIIGILIRQPVHRRPFLRGLAGDDHVATGLGNHLHWRVIEEHHVPLHELSSMLRSVEKQLSVWRYESADMIQLYSSKLICRNNV